MKTKVKITKAYYTWHPNFIDNHDGTYEISNGGNWVVEWDVKSKPDRYHTKHNTAICDSEKMAKRLLNILTRKQKGPDTYILVDQNDICLKSGKFCFFDKHLIIVACDAKTTTQSV